ncbi:MAG TPA: AAA family ATPase [Pirellulales bacterium]|nr:AAA family ATPase [Pirellulales bacterium]
MKLVSAEVDGFGVWSGLKLENLADRMTVLYGPNEAGKTTLLEFLRSMLYGFSPQRWQRYLPPVHGGKRGGALVVAGAAGRFTIRRHAADEPGDGELRILSSDGALQSDGLLLQKGLLGGIGEATFNQVFAVGLREMQELGTLSDSAAAEFLYHLSVGFSGIGLCDMLRELSSARRRILSTEPAACRLGELLKEGGRLRSEIDELRSQVHRQAAIVHELSELARDVEASEAERAELERAARAVETALAVRVPWHRRKELIRQIAALPPLAAVPSGTIERLDQVNEALESRRRRIAEIVRTRRNLRAEAAALDFNPKLARHAPRIEGLAEQEAWLNTLETQVDELTSEIARLESGLAQYHRDLGLEGKRASDKLTVSDAAVKRLRPAARALARPQARLRTARQEESESTRQAEELAGQIRSALSESKEKELAPALERAGNLVAQLRRRVQVDERLSQLARHEGELADQGRLLLDRQLLPAWVLIGLGAVFVLGVVLVLASMFLPLSLVGSAGWALAAIGALGAAGGAGGKYLLDRSAANQLDACQKQATILASQIKQAKEERESLDAQLPRGGGPLLTRLQTAEKDLAALEELLGVDSQRQAALAAAQAARGRLAAAEAELRDARRRWEQALSSAGLPKHLTVKVVKRLAGRHGEMAGVRREQERRYDELHKRQGEYDLLSGRIKQLLADVGLKPVSDRPADQLNQLTAQLAAHQVVSAQRDALNERSIRLRRQQSKLAAAIRRGEQRRQQLLGEAAAASEAELRERAAEHARRRSLADARDGLSRDIALGLAGRLSEEEVRGWLDGVESPELATRGTELAGQVKQLTSRLHALYEQRGRLEQEATLLVEDRSLASRLVDLEMVEDQIREAIDRWRALTVTESTLDGVRRAYETDRQPEALKQASEYLRPLTGGRYTRVWAPLGERGLKVDDSDGRTLSVEVLSRGTREQLFLSLRLALVRVYARRGVDLPLVLDDVLVNFDARRAKAAAGVLRDFAESGHQVLVFTCHEHLWKLFRHLKVAAHELPANDDSEPITVVYPRQIADVPAEPAAEHRETEEGERKKHEAAVAWHPEPAGDGMIELADDDEEDDEPVKPVKRKRRKSGRKRGTPAVHEAPADEPPADQQDERPHRVTVVRGDQMQHPFADTNWHEPVDEELDEEEDEVEVSAAGEEAAPFDIDDEAPLWPDEEPLYNDSDDWPSHDDEDEIEAA